MNNIIHRQNGISLIGFVIVLAVLAAFVMLGLRLFPLYSTKFRVLDVMKYVASQPGAEKFSQTDVWNLFYKNADIQGLSMFGKDQTVKDDVKLEKGDKSGAVIHVTFEERNPLFGDIELVLDFDESMPLGGGVSGGNE